MFTDVTSKPSSRFLSSAKKISRYLMLSASFATMLVSTHLLSSACHAMNESDAQKAAPTTKAAQRSINTAGWKQLPSAHKQKLIPGQDGQPSIVATPIHGRQFVDHGKIEAAFRSAIKNIPEGNVIVWGDGYGRIALDAFRRNGNIRVIYNDIDPQNMEPMQDFKRMCVKAKDQDQLVPIAGDCLTVPSDQGFKDLFPGGHANGQAAMTFGANFLHFMEPEEIVRYFALQFDLLAPGGKTFSINMALPQNDVTMDDYIQQHAGREALVDWLTSSAPFKVHLKNATKTIGMNEISRILKNDDFLFPAQMRGEWVKENQGTSDPVHRMLLTAFYKGHAKVGFTPLETIESIAKIIGFQVCSRYSFTYTPEGLNEKDDGTGAYIGIVLQKPEVAPSPTDENYFRNTKTFQALEKRALAEVELARELFRRVEFKPQYPFFFLNKGGAA